jgi:hypothetical protein
MPAGKPYRPSISYAVGLAVEFPGSTSGAGAGAGAGLVAVAVARMAATATRSGRRCFAIASAWDMMSSAWAIAGAWMALSFGSVPYIERARANNL